MPDHEYVIPPRLPGESELRVILTDDQARDFEAAYKALVEWLSSRKVGGEGQ